MLLRYLFSIWFSLISTSLLASHIVGGEFTYRCIGSDKYEFTLNLYRDCLPPNMGGGNPAALAEDDPAFISIYRGFSFFLFDSVFSSSSILVPVNFKNECLNNPPVTCINRLQFVFTVTLPASSQGYTILCQRCCRNASINNITSPGNTGATYSCTIPPSPVLCNNSAVFQNYPPQIICINNPLIYDHSAFDPDADSLSYSFCNAIRGGSPTDPKPSLTSGSLPAMTSVNYVSPLSGTNPMAGNPLIKIDPHTGLITGTPNLLGRFVVNVCCTEWRAGVPINVISREFQFVVTNCSKAVIANTPLFSDEPNTYIVSCKSKTVHFQNSSSGGFRYFWDFGVASTNSDTSDQFEPTYTYADTGTYLITLYVNKGSDCADSIQRIVKVYPDFEAAFDYKGLLCPESPIDFIDKSTSTLENINYWMWTFGDGASSTVQNPTHSYGNTGNNFLVTLISGNAMGCRDTASQTLAIPSVHVFAGNDTVIVKNTLFTFNGSGAQQYQWSPSGPLDNPFIFNPSATFSDTGRYTFTLQGVTENGCIGNDTIVITVANGPYLNIPNAFSPNGDGLNDVFLILAAGYKQLNYYRIFNRWGEQVFYSRNFRTGWDGSYKGKPCEMGTYFYLISARDTDNKELMIKGDVTLIR